MGWLTETGRLTWAASRGASRAIESAIASAQFNRADRGSHGGLVGPWDPPPSPAAGGAFYDYSAAARPQDLTENSTDFPVGRYRVPRRRWDAIEPFGLSEATVNRHVLVVAPTRSGKTASIVAPWIHSAIRLGQSVLAIDVKGGGDLIGEVKRFGRTQPRLGGAPIFSWDYTAPQRSVSWNWIHDLGDDASINAAVEAICGKPAPSDPNRNFHLRDMQYLRGLLELAPALPGDTTVRDLVDVINDQDQLESLITRCSGQQGARRLSGLCGLPSGAYQAAIAFVVTKLSVLDVAGFNAVTARRELVMSKLSMQAGLHVVTAPVADGALSAAASGLFLSLFVHHRLRQFGQSPIPLFLALDESPRLQDRIGLGELLSLAAGAGISILLAAQDVNQFNQDGRDEILANCGTVIVLPGASASTTDFLVSRVGPRRVVRAQRSLTHDRRSGTSRGLSHTHDTEPALGHGEIASPPFGPYAAVVHSPRVSPRPILVDLARRDLVAGP